MKNLTFMPLLALFIALGNVHFNYAAATREPLTPQNTIITWDVDDVMLQKPAKATTIAYIMSQILFHPSIITTWYYSNNRPESNIEYIKFFKDNGYNNIVQSIESITHGKQPIQKSVEIAQLLNTKGFNQSIATNMNCEDFEYYITQPTTTFLKEYFRYSQCVAADAHGERVKKSNPRYFEKYFTGRPPEYQKLYMIFIDDKQANIDMAINVGRESGIVVIGIKFENPAQLINDLELYLGNIDTLPEISSAQ